MSILSYGIWVCYFGNRNDLLDTVRNMIVLEIKTCSAAQHVSIFLRLWWVNVLNNEIPPCVGYKIKHRNLSLPIMLFQGETSPSTSITASPCEWPIVCVYTAAFPEESYKFADTHFITHVFGLPLAYSTYVTPLSHFPGIFLMILSCDWTFAI